MQFGSVTNCGKIETNGFAFRATGKFFSLFTWLMADARKKGNISISKRCDTYFQIGKLMALMCSANLLAWCERAHWNLITTLIFSVQHSVNVCARKSFKTWESVQWRAARSTNLWPFARKNHFFLFVMTWECGDQWRRTKNQGNKVCIVWAARAWGKHQVHDIIYILAVHNSESLSFSLALIRQISIVRFCHLSKSFWSFYTLPQVSMKLISQAEVQGKDPASKWVKYCPYSSNQALHMTKVGYKLRNMTFHEHRDSSDVPPNHSIEKTKPDPFYSWTHSCIKWYREFFRCFHLKGKVRMRQQIKKPQSVEGWRIGSSCHCEKD